jgi:GNAT superfamily N-acetyltransferase
VRFLSEIYATFVLKIDSYEIQVSNEYRRCGLGKVLMQKLADIGATWGMQKLMLTVFKGIMRCFITEN